MVRFLRTSEFDSLFSGGSHLGDGGAGRHGAGWSHPGQQTTFRYLHTLHTMGPAPEPNLDRALVAALPAAFKKYAAWVSIATSSLRV
ncbi:hypothetical protein LN650_12215 [Klebsiella pneumoniae subsp. pneumoniae]|nr:hypothetical protein [Klebsiella pneumoniae subsp. pneumoniae]